MSKPSSAAETTAALVTVRKHPPQYDEQIQFFLDDQTPLAHTPYVLTLVDGSTVEGVTDQDGNTQRVVTGQPLAITAAELTPTIYCCACGIEHADKTSGSAPDRFKAKLQGIATNNQKIGISKVAYVFEPSKSRGLTAGEIVIARKLFKDSIDYGIVKVHDGGLYGLPEKTNNAMTPRGQIYFPSGGYQDDFSNKSTADDDDRVWFMHEMTHVWQFQQGYAVWFHGVGILLRGGYNTDGVVENGRRLPAYVFRYDLKGADAGKQMPDFNMEQQAQLVSHYFDALYQPDNPSLAHSKRRAILHELELALGTFRHNPNDPSLLPTQGSYFS